MNTITGDSGINVLTGTVNDDLIIAHEGDDTMAGNGGDDVLFGGDGIDQADFSGNSADYSIDQLGSAIEVNDLLITTGSNDGKDLLLGVEKLYFNNDGGTSTTFTTTMATDFKVSDNSGPEFISAPDVAGLAHGGHVTVWESNYMGTYNISMRVFDEEGVAGTTTAVINNGFQTDTARVEALVDGGYVITWVQNEGVGDLGDVIAVVYNADGSVNTTFSGVGGFEVGATGAIDQVSISVAASDHGGFVTTWAEDGNIKAKVYDMDGTSSLHNIETNGNTSDGAEVTALANGGYAITWQEDDTSNVAVKLAIYDEDDVLQGSIVTLDGTSVDDVHSRDITVLGNGNILVTWTAEETGDANLDAMAAIYNSAGTEVVAPFQLNTIDNDAETTVSVTALNDGNFVAVWRTEGMDTDGGGIFGRIYNNVGAPQTDSFLMNSDVVGDQALPRVTATTEGFVAAWSTDDSEIYQQAFNNDGGLLAGVTIHGNAGIDDNIVGGAGSQIFIGDSGNDTYDGGIGTDTVNYYSYNEAMTIDLSANSASSGTSGNDVLFGIEKIIATDYGDTITGDANDNTIVAKAGDDTIIAGAGDDVISLGNGTDNVDAGAGDDKILVGDSGGGGVNYINGGAGTNDWISFDIEAPSSGADFDLSIVGDGVSGGSGDQILYSEYGTVDVQGIEHVKGSEHDDTLTGDANINTLVGLEGNDTLDGAAGDDKLVGGDGMDVLIGGQGNDILVGGSGDDIFRFETSSQTTGFSDYIVDFEGQSEGGNDEIHIGGDVLGSVGGNNGDIPSLSGLEFFTGVAVTDQAAALAGTLGTNTNPTVIFLQGDDTNNSELYVDTNGNTAGGVEKVADLDGYTTVVSGDIRIFDTGFTPT